MTTPPDQNDDRNTLAAVRARIEAMPWTKRLELAHRLADEPAACFEAPEITTVPSVLAGDPKPEVRQAVANLLGHLPEQVFAPLCERLRRDPNAFVVSAVRRAINRRERAAREAKRVRFGADQIQKHLRRLEKRHGPAAARDASRLCERYTQLLVASMVHDLRSILTHLKANTLALLAETSVTQNQRAARLPARVRDDLEFLEQTVADMEQFTEPTDAARQDEPLAEVVRAAHEIARANVRAGGDVDPEAVRCTAAIRADLVVPMSRHLLVAAFANIIKNAYEAFAGGWCKRSVARIHVTVRQAGESVELFVRDNGMGFDQQEADGLRLFTPGRRNKSKASSTGYGLPNAVRKIVAHGGTVHFESQEGSGTTVTIRLPLRITEG